MSDDFLSDLVAPVSPSDDVLPTESIVEVPAEPVAVVTENALAEVNADLILDMIMSKIVPAGEDNAKLKVLIYGDPGVGKTVFSGSSPKPLTIDIDDGTESYANHDETRGNMVYPFKSVKGLEMLIEKLAEKNELSDKFETVIIDSFSHLQKIDLDEILKQAHIDDSDKNPYLPVGPDYNVNTEHMRQIAYALRSLAQAGTCNIIVTCHVREVKDDSTGTVFIRPDLTPKLAATFGGIFDLIGYMSRRIEGGQEVRTLQVHPTPRISAKTRIGGLPPVMINPTFNDIISAREAARNGQLRQAGA